MKSSLLLAVGALFLTPFSTLKATTISFGVNPSSRTVNNEAGVLLTTTSSFWIGTFSSEASIAGVVNNAQSVAANVAAITTAGGWEQFTMDTTSNLLNAGATSTLEISSSPANRLGGTASDTATGATKADFFNGKQIYVWLFNADTVGAATEMGIFEATSALVPWIFPTNAGGVGDTLSLSTTVASATIAEVGGVGSISGSQLRTEAFSAVVAPEPSRIVLLGLGALGFVFRRRRA